MKHTLALGAFTALCALVSAQLAHLDSDEDTSDYIEVNFQPPPSRPIFVPVSLINRRNISSSALVSNTTSGHVGLQNHRIVGGREIPINTAPWQVAVIRETTFTCGGSIISSIWVLTAAHCVYGSINRRYAVRAGSDYFKRGGQLRLVQRISYHAGYNQNSAVNDIAMLRVQRPFTFGANVRAIRLATAQVTPSTYSLSGWGTLSENASNPTVRLRGVSVRSVARNTCARQYNGIIRITANMICASAPGQDSCQGDSGGALVSRNAQYGIVSLGVGCARSRYPGVYTYVPKYTTWINTVMRIFGQRDSGRYLHRD